MKRIKKLLCLLIITLFSILLISFSTNIQNRTTNSNIEKTETQSAMDVAKIHYIDVGQGDSELIQIGDKNILIDAGDTDKKALNYLQSVGITTIDYAIATHPHRDHIGSLDNVIKKFNIGAFYSTKATNTTNSYENLINALEIEKLKTIEPKVGDEITIGDATLTFLAPNSEEYEDLNNYSIVCKLKYGNTSFIFMGDALKLSQKEMLEKQLDVQADVIKLGNHGSNEGTYKTFLETVNPKYAVISCGKNDSPDHPNQKTIDKLNERNINVFRTDLNGTIIATSDGNNITFNTEPLDKSVNVAMTR